MAKDRRNPKRDVPTRAPRRKRRAPPAGAIPGHMELPPGAPPPSLRVIVYDEDRAEERALGGVEELPGLLATPGRVVWIDLDGLGDAAVLERLREILEIHPLAMADAVHVPQRPKAEPWGDRLFVLLQMARLVGSAEVEIEIEQVGLFLGPGFVATIQERPGDVFDPVRQRIRASAGRIRRMGADYLAYALVDAIVDGYFPVIEALASMLDRLEEQVVVARPTPVTLARIHAARRLLHDLGRIQWAHRDALASLVRDEESPIGEPVRIYLRDVHDHAYQTLDAIESQRELAASLLDLHLSSASHRMSEVMRTLTVVSTIFIPLTFLVGVYGMNFDVMPELRWRFAYFVLWGCMLAAGGGLFAWFRTRGWIGAPADRAEVD